MKNITISKKTKAIIYAIAFTFVFAFGAYVRPGIDIALTLASSLFASKQTYVAPLSEYEAKVETLWHSERHQAVCKANAASVVAIQLARKYLDEADKQTVLSSYDMPADEAITKQGEFTR